MYRKSIIKISKVHLNNFHGFRRDFHNVGVLGHKVDCQ